MHGWITCRAMLLPGNAGDVIGNEIGANSGVGVRASEVASVVIFCGVSE